MQWRGRRESSNVEDRRGGGSGGGQKTIIGGGLGTIVIIIFALLLGKNPLEVLQLVGSGQATVQSETPTPNHPADDDAASFVKVVLADCEDVWTEQFRAQGMTYQKPTLVLFRQQVRSGCGEASAASGPFYCSADDKIYIDLSFYDVLHSRLNAPGDFAMAYVIAHEVGHHIQHQLGISDKVHAARARLSETEYNKLSVKLELQADFLAGVWAHHAQQTKQILEPGDIEEALNAANAIGDDRLQKQAQGYVVPDGFTHGTSAQRMRWFKKGFDTGDLNQGDTFGAAVL